MIYVVGVIFALLAPHQDSEPELDFTRISQPAIASQIELSDEQRAKVSELLTERINKLAASKPAERDAIRKANNKQLRDLLSPTQIKKYQDIVVGGKLRFNFRGEKWADVLNWFAGQAELSLVLDQAPAGEFTYSDQKEYTAAQAIDLLNSVLLSKGFTLIRREKMLIVANLENGIPYELVPNESMEGLAKRGKFEWVRVKFPLQGRPIAAVLEEVKPMIGEHGLATPLTASGQLLVTETAGKMEAISVLVAAVPVPTSPPPPPKPVPPPPKVFVVHSAKGLDIDATVETLRTFFSTTAVVGDPKAEEIQVYAQQDTQDLIKSSLDQMIANASTELKAYAETYTVTDLPLASLSAQISELFPEIKLTVDQENERFVVIANAKTQKGIQETLDKLGAKRQEKEDISVVIYSSPAGEGEELATVLKEMLPRAQVIVQNDRIAVRGRKSEQAIAKSLVDQVSSASDSKMVKQIRFYELNSSQEAVTTTIQSMVAEGTVTWMESQKKLVVIADPATQDLIKQTIEQINLDLPARKKRALKIYLVTADQKERFEKVFESMSEEFPGVTVISGAAANEVAILADDDQQSAVEELINSMAKLGRSDKGELSSISVSVADTSQLVSLLNEKYPQHQFIVNAEQDALLVWIEKTALEDLKKSVAEIEAQLPKKEIQSLQIYKTAESLADVETFLTPVIGKAKVTPDPVGKRLLVWGTAQEHEKIKEVLAQLETDKPTGKKLEVYKLDKGKLDVAQELISTTETDATVTAVTESDSLLVWGTEETHSRIKKLISQLTELKSPGKPGVEVFPVDRDHAQKTLAAIQAVFPTANISLGSNSEKIISIADDELQVQIRALIEKLQPNKPVGPRVLMSYELKHADAASVVEMLQELHPNTRFAADQRANRILVTAELAEQPKFKAMIGQLDAKSSDRDEKVLQSYSLNLKPEMVSDLLVPLFPDMKMSVDETTRKIVVLGTPFDHQKLANVLKQLDDKNASTKKVLKEYSIGEAPAEQVENVLLQIVPTAILATNAAKQKLVAWASEEDHKLIADAVKQLSTAVPDLSLKSYDLNRPVGAEVTSLLQEVAKTARLAVSADSKQLIVYASAADQRLIESAITELMSRTDKETELKAYLGEVEVVADASQYISSTLADARIVSQANAKKLLVWATLEDHQKIARAIESLKQQLAGTRPDQTIVIYPLGKVDGDTAISMINKEVPEAQSLTGSLTGRLIIRATKTGHAQVSKIIGELKKTFDVIRSQTIKSHAIRKDLKEQATTTISSLIPSVEFIPNGDAALLLVKASAEDHQAIDSLIKTLDAEIAKPEPRTIAAYSLKNLSKELALQYLSGRFANLTSVDDADAKRILLWATPTEHKAIPDLLKQLQDTLAQESKLTVQVYNVDAKKMTAADVLTLIDTQLRENTTIQVSVETNSLVIRASEERHNELKTAIAAIVTQINVKPDPTTVIYEIPSGNAAAISTLLTPLLTEATQSVSTDGKKLAVTSGAAGQKLVKSVVEQWNTKNTQPNRTTQVYRLNATVPSIVESAVVSMSPQAEVIADDNSKSLIVTASQKDHEAIADILKQINDSTLGKKTEVFTLKVADPANLVAAVTELVTDIKATADAATRSVIVTAREADFPQIQLIVDKLEKVANDQITSMVSKVYPFDQNLVDAVDMQAVISPEMREGMSVRINEVGNGLIIRTTPEKHAQLKTVFDQVIEQLPESKKIEARVYRLDRVTPAAIENALGARFSNNDFSVDENTRTVVATVSLADHEIIKGILTEMEKQPVGDPLVSKAFKLRSATPSIVASAIESLLPNAKVAFDNAAKSVIVTGMEADIKSAADLVTQIDGSGEGKSTRVYRLAEANPRYVSPAIQSLIPNAEVSADVYSKALFVTATDEEHEQVQQMVDELNTKKGQRSEVYLLTTADPRFVMPAVQALLPNATVTADRYSKSLFVTGTDDDHQEVAKLVEKMNSKSGGQKSEVYRLSKADPIFVLPAIKSLLPNATVAGDRFSKSLFVTGTEEDHKQVANLVEKMNGQTVDQRSEVYRLTQADPRYVMPAIQSLLPEATVTGDRYIKSLFVTGSDEDHQQVKQLIEKLNGNATGQTTEVYKLDKASAILLQPAIQALVPEGSVTSDKLSNTVVVSTTAEGHLKVAEVIEKLDRASNEELVLKIYKSKFDNPDPLNQAIGNMFRDDELVRINFEWENRRILVVASEKKHKLIQSLIEQVDQAKPEYDDRFAKVYHLENIESRAAESVMRNLYGWWAPRLEFRVQDGTNALIVVATAEQHKALNTAVKEIDGDLRQLEVFSLVNVDPYTIELAVDQLFAEIPENMRPTATSDFGTQQLFVRGTEAQIKLIRDLLNKMGENFGDADKPLSKGAVRTIPFRGNAMEALKEIESIWPRIRKNRIEIIQPGKTKINRLPRRGEEEKNSPGSDSATPRSGDPKKTEPKIEPSSQPNKLPEEECGGFDEGFQELGEGSREATSGPGNDPAEKIKKLVQDNENPRIQIEDLEPRRKNTDGKQDDSATDQEKQPQVVVIAGNNEVTIASSDLEALDQLEYLLRTLQRSQRSGIGSSNFAVFLLANSSAKETAKLLTDLFKAIPETERQGSVGNAVFVADERLNAMIVYGTRKERDVIKEIIEVLDAEDLPDSLTTPLPELVQVQNSSADRVLEILRSVYSNQLSSGGGRPKVDIPEGVSSAVATLLQQINAATTGPILTLGVDEQTNSIVLRAPAELGREIKSFIQRLDDSAKTISAKKIRVFQLHGTNADRVRRILNTMAKEGQ